MHLNQVMENSSTCPAYLLWRDSRHARKPSLTPYHVHTKRFNLAGSHDSENRGGVAGPSAGRVVLLGGFPNLLTGPLVLRVKYESITDACFLDDGEKQRERMSIRSGNLAARERAPPVLIRG